MAMPGGSHRLGEAASSGGSRERQSTTAGLQHQSRNRGLIFQTPQLVSGCRGFSSSSGSVGKKAGSPQ